MSQKLTFAKAPQLRYIHLFIYLFIYSFTSYQNIFTHNNSSAKGYFAQGPEIYNDLYSVEDKSAHIWSITGTISCRTRIQAFCI